MNIVKTSELGELYKGFSEKVNKESFIFDFGEVVSGTKIELDINITDATNFELVPTCGCTVPTNVKNEDGSYTSKIEYTRNTRLGKVDKFLKLKTGTEKGLVTDFLIIRGTIK